MFKNILIPIDGSAPTLAAIRAALDLAQKGRGRIVVLAVAEPLSAAAGDGADRVPAIDEALRAEALQRAAHAVRIAREAGVEASAVVAVSAHPHDEIVRTARAQQCDLIVMASHAREGMELAFNDSQTHRVMLDCALPVLVMRP